MTPAEARAVVRPFNASLADTMSDSEALDTARLIQSAQREAAWSTFWLLLALGAAGWATVKYAGPELRRLTA